MAYGQPLEMVFTRCLLAECLPQISGLAGNGDAILGLSSLHLSSERMLAMENDPRKFGRLLSLSAKEPLSVLSLSCV